MVSNMQVIDTSTTKSAISPNYNFIFNKINGAFSRWGATFDDDPECAPSPEIADIEISTICNHGCKFCYKSNTCDGTYMDLKTFKTVFSKLPNTITQVAFGIGSINNIVYFRRRK